MQDLQDGESAELPGASRLLGDDSQIFHAYSAHARVLDHVDAASAYLDLQKAPRLGLPDPGVANIALITVGGQADAVRLDRTDGVL